VVGSSRSAGKGQEPSPAVFICFNYSPHAESIQLQLNLSTPMIEPPPAQVQPAQAEAAFDEYPEPDAFEAKGSEREDPELRAVFDLFDSDASGKISADELQDAMEALGMDTSDDQVDTVLANVDVDGSGNVDFKEFCRIMGSDALAGGNNHKEEEELTPRGNQFEQEEEMLPEEGLTDMEILEVFNLFDVDNSGFIDASELEDAMEALGMGNVTDEEVDRIIANCGHGDRISFNDFAKVFSTGPVGQEQKQGPVPTPRQDAAPLKPAMSKAERRRQAAGQAPDLTEDQRWQLQEAFEVFDLDGAGYINAAELGDAMEALGIEATTQMVDGLLASAGKGLADVIELPMFVSMVGPVLVSMPPEDRYPDF